MGNTLYETDFYQWTQETLQAIRERDIEHLDWGHLAEEVEALENEQKRAVKSYLRQLLIHLLCYQFWQSNRSQYLKGWRNEIDEFRYQLKDRLESKTLSNYFVTQVDKVYKEARRKALFKSEQNPSTFPEQCPYTVEQMLDPEFFPEP